MPVDLRHPIDVAAWSFIREPFSAFTHLLGAMVFAIFAARLIRQGRGDRVRVLSLAIFAGCSIELLLMSGIYHIFWPGPARSLMLRIDVAGIFLLIAASMTPGHAILFTGFGRWGSLALIWAVAIGGIVWRVILSDDTPGTSGIVIFLLFGWGSLWTAVILWRRYGWPFIQPAFFSGVSYTIGAVCLMQGVPTLWPDVIGPHEFWHLTVLLGLALQWKFVSQFASGAVRSLRRPQSVKLPQHTENVR